MLLIVLLQVALLHPSAAYSLGSSFPQDKVTVENNDILPNPSVHVIGTNYTTLITCRRVNERVVDSRSLYVKCRGLRQRVSLERLTTVDYDVPSVTTSRLILTSHAVKNFKHRIVCYCVDVLIRHKSAGLVISMKKFSQAPKSHFKPKRNRKRTVSMHGPVNMSWRFANSSSGVHCFHDSQPLTKKRIVFTRGKTTIRISEALRADAGFYYCRSKSGAFSSWFKLQVEGAWSRWRPWLACSAQCGTGKKVETRKCLETGRDRCRGPSVRTLPCVAPCTGIVPEFVMEPQDQSNNGSSTFLTCLVQFGSATFTVQLFCSSNGWKISYFLSDTVVTQTANKTVIRKTYKIELNRDRNNLAEVNCHCDTSANGISKRSRIAKIRFTSDKGNNSKKSPNGHVFRSSVSFSPTPTEFQDEMRLAHTLHNENDNPAVAKTVIVAVSCLICFSTLLVFLSLLFYHYRLKRIQCTCKQDGSVATSETNISRSTSIVAERAGDLCSRTTPEADSNVSIPSNDGTWDHQRASHRPLLNCNFKENSYPLQHGSPRSPLDDSTMREENLDYGSVFRRGESWKSNTSKFSSVSSPFFPKPEMPDTVDPDLCAWGQFSDKGGRLTIQGTGVRLDIPCMALPKHKSQVIYIGLMNSKGNYPKLSAKEALISPVVVCGPDGLTFDKPVYLTVPHNAVLDENNSWSPQVRSCSTVSEDPDENKWKVNKGDVPVSHVSDKYMQIMTEHFTNFAIVGVANCSEETRPQLKTWVVAFFTEPKVNQDCSVRVYCIQATDAAYKVLEGIESEVSGKISDTRKLLRIIENEQRLQIKSMHLKEGWSVVTDEKFIPFLDIWQGIKESPNVSFVFERVSANAFKFSTIFDVKQEDSPHGVQVHVMFSIQNDRRESSGYSSQANGCEVDVIKQIPSTIRTQICYLLDVERANDWRMFAEKMGCKNAYINWLKGNEKIKSPTDELIDWWEMTKSEEIPLQHLLQIFKDMKRHDVVKVLEKIQDN